MLLHLFLLSLLSVNAPALLLIPREPTYRSRTRVNQGKEKNTIMEAKIHEQDLQCLSTNGFMKQQSLATLQFK